jgi:hypothetical protein
MDRHAHWQEIYQSKAETEVSWHQDHPAASLTLIKDAGPAEGCEESSMPEAARRVSSIALSKRDGPISPFSISLRLRWTKRVQRFQFCGLQRV